MGVFLGNSSFRNSSFRNSSLGNFRLGILEFPIEILRSSWGMTGNLEFLRINLEFIEIASLRSQ